MGLFIPTNKLQNLKLYKYSSEDHSIISKYILKKWWNFFVQIFPLSMAPNVVTLLGLFFIIGNLMTVFYYDPYLNETQPTWCYFFMPLDYLCIKHLMDVMDVMLVERVKVVPWGII